MSLRDYQQAAIDGVRAAAKTNPVLVAPTGSGKTVMGCALVRAAVAKGRRVLWLAHRMELIDQAVERLQREGIEPGVVMAGRTPNLRAFVQVASVQTLIRRDLGEWTPDAIFVDEAHHVRARTYLSLFKRWPGVVRVGLTATPFRTDGRGLGDVFGSIVVAATVDELCDAGHLIEPRVFAPPGPDLRGVRKTGGDFNPEQIAGIMDRPGLTGDIVETWKARAPGAKTVVFATSVQHSQHVVEAFKAAGVAAEHLDGETPVAERKRILADLRSGALTVVSNCGVLTEGWDLPALACCIIARPTASLGLHLQMIGRVLRPEAGKPFAIVLDHAGNTRRHGLPTDPLEFSLGDDVKRKDPEARTTKTCPVCFAVVKVSARVCPACGSEFVPQPRPGPEVRGGDLTEVAKGGPLYPNATEAERRASYANLLRTAHQRGYLQSWAGMRFLRLYGKWPEGMRDIVAEAVGECRHVRGDDEHGKPWACRFCGVYRPSHLAREGEIQPMNARA